MKGSQSNRLYSYSTQYTSCNFLGGWGKSETSVDKKATKISTKHFCHLLPTVGLPDRIFFPSYQLVVLKMCFCVSHPLLPFPKARFATNVARHQKDIFHFLLIEWQTDVKRLRVGKIVFNSITHLIFT